MPEYPPESLMQMNNPGMAANINMSGDPGIPSAYQRGPQMYPYQNPNMTPGPGIRPPHVSPQQQSVYNQMPGQMPMDMMPQQRKFTEITLLLFIVMNTFTSCFNSLLFLVDR